MTRNIEMHRFLGVAVEPQEWSDLLHGGRTRIGNFHGLDAHSRSGRRGIDNPIEIIFCTPVFKPASYEAAIRGTVARVPDGPGQLRVRKTFVRRRFVPNGGKAPPWPSAPADSRPGRRERRERSRA